MEQLSDHKQTADDLAWLIWFFSEISKKEKKSYFTCSLPAFFPQNTPSVVQRCETSAAVTADLRDHKL